jgi:hypothetical protein
MSFRHSSQHAMSREGITSIVDQKATGWKPIPREDTNLSLVV